jgi:hypothetical protein
MNQAAVKNCPSILPLCVFSFVFVMRLLLHIAIALVLLLAATLSSCRQDRFTPNANVDLRFETDTLLFDTVFVTAGSITKRFKVYNPTNQNIAIDEVYLAGRRFTGNSPYRININGIPTNNLAGVELLAGDSMYVFVEVTIDPNSSNTPFIVTDSVIFRSGNRTGKVLLAAYGQNAVFYNGEILPCNTVWTADKPIVVYNSVLVDSACQLTILPGAKVYFNKNSTLFVLGSLRVNGLPEQPVTFRGDRLDPFYRDLAGAWNGIHFLVGSTNNEIRSAEMYNGNIAIRVDSLPADGSASPNLILNRVRIDNFAIVGLLGFTARIEAYNTLISNCGLYNFLGDFGGEYTFRHATLVNFSTGFSRGFPLFALTNRDLNGRPNVARLVMQNSIVWGSRQEEFALDTTRATGFTVELSHTTLRSQRTQLVGTALQFTDPRFKNVGEKNFEIDTLSPAFRAGANLIPLYPRLQTDLLGRSRAAQPTLGALERIE